MLESAVVVQTNTALSANWQGFPSPLDTLAGHDEPFRAALDGATPNLPAEVAWSIPRQGLEGVDDVLDANATRR